MSFLFSVIILIHSLELHMVVLFILSYFEVSFAKFGKSFDIAKKLKLYFLLLWDMEAAAPGMGAAAIIGEMISGDEDLFYGPGFSGAENHVAKVGKSFRTFHFLYLGCNLCLVGGCIYVADHTDSHGECYAVHHGEHLMEEP